jgi:hypothetical protein
MASSGRSFSLFPLLSTELRLKIWEEILPGPRLVEIRERNIDDSSIDSSDSGSDISTTVSEIPELQSTIFTNVGSPPTSAVCHESREVVLRKYSSQMRRATNSPCVWIDPELDVVYLAADLPVDQDLHDNLCDIRHIAVRHQNSLPPKCFPGSALYYLFRLPRLESFTVIMHSRFCKNVNSWDLNSFVDLRGCDLELCEPQDENSKDAVKKNFQQLDSLMKERRSVDQSIKEPSIEVKMLKINKEECCHLVAGEHVGAMDLGRSNRTARMKANRIRGRGQIRRGRGVGWRGRGQGRTSSITG